MPTTYAHYSFGNECIEIMPDDASRAVLKYRHLYDFGVHGPDLFFYYQALKKNNVNQFGSDMHKKSADMFFINARNVYREKDNKDAMLAYLLGFLSHFVFDFFAHSYIEAKIEKSQVSHSKIESQYDRYLMVKNGYDPLKYDRAASLRPSLFAAEIIHRFFPFDGKTILECMNGQIVSLKALWTRTALKRWLISGAITTFGINADFIDLLIDEEEMDVCRDSNLRLDKLKEMAKVKLAKLLPAFLRYFQDEEAALDHFFANNFTFKADYRSIPVLTYQEELVYDLNNTKGIAENV